MMFELKALTASIESLANLHFSYLHLYALRLTGFAQASAGKPEVVRLQLGRITRILEVKFICCLT